MHVAKFLFYNMYVPSEIKPIVDAYYSANQTNIITTFRDDPSSNQETGLNNKRDVLLNYLINDDIQISANSSYTTLNDFFSLGELGGLTDKMVATEGGVTGAVSQDHNNFRNIFNYSLWDKTEPMNTHFKIVLYSKTDPLVDVVIPAYMMMSHAGLDKISSGGAKPIQYAVPGVSFNMAMNIYNRAKLTEANSAPTLQSASGIVEREGYIYNSAKSSANVFVFSDKNQKRPRKDKIFYKQDLSFNSKVLSFLIDGLIYMDIGTIKSVSVTCSKHTAKTKEKYKSDTTNKIIDLEGDFPIWMELDIHLESIRPAMSYMLWNSLNGRNILNNSFDQTSFQP